MNNLQLINYIASHSEFTTIVIKDDDERTPMQAIELLSSVDFDNIWRINGSLEAGILIVNDKN